MKILVTGKGGKSGSWQMRGEQLGAALGADIKPMTGPTDHDVTVVVKRTPPEVIAKLNGRKWAWDIVDAFPQPVAYRWDKADAVAWVRSKIKALSATAIIWPNQRMRDDCDTGLPGLVLPHHHRIGIKANPIREKVSKVGYEGSPAYLGKWTDMVNEECKKRGCEFVVNPSSLSDLDIVVAFRDNPGYVGRHWKSAIKLQNAHASGTPFVGSPETGYLENASGAEYWAETPAQLAMSFDWLVDQGARETISDRFIQKRFPVEHAAVMLKDFLRGL
jgi:hypothetical protein